MSAMATVRENAGTTGFERRTGHREAMLQLRYEDLTAADAELCVEMFRSTKDSFTRNQLLTALVLRGGAADLEDFFLSVARRSRLHDQRLTAIRGYAATAAEEDVAPLMDALSWALTKVGSAPLRRTSCTRCCCPPSDCRTSWTATGTTASTGRWTRSGRSTSRCPRTRRGCSPMTSTVRR